MSNCVNLSLRFLILLSNLVLDLDLDTSWSNFCRQPCLTESDQFGQKSPAIMATQSVSTYCLAGAVFLQSVIPRWAHNHHQGISWSAFFGLLIMFDIGNLHLW